MATVTGYTAARMKQIEDSAVVDGEVVGNNLLLEPHGFATNPTGYPKIDAGNVRGPQGIQGVPGEVTQAQLDAAMAATRVAAGIIEMWGGDVAPTGYLMCNGQAVDRVAYAALFAAIGTKWGVGNGTTTFNVPPFDNRFPVGKGTAPHAALNDRGGNKDAILAEHQHVNPNHQHSTPAHQHSTASHVHDVSHTHSTDIVPAGAPHTHTGTTNTDGSHNHYLSEFGNKQFLTKTDSVGPNNIPVTEGNNLIEWRADVGDAGETHAHAFTTNEGGAGELHDHQILFYPYNANSGPSGALTTTAGEGASTTVAGGTTTTPTIGSPVTNANLPPFITVNFIIKT